MAPLPAGVAHAAALAAIHATSFPPAASWDAPALATLLALPGVAAWIDPEGGFVLARVVADEAEILTLVVVPEQRRHGRGRALLRAALAHAARAGARSMFLEVAAHNAAARGLYAAAGFREVGRRRGYYADGGDALVLRRALDASDALPHRAPP